MDFVVFVIFFNLSQEIKPHMTNCPNSPLELITTVFFVSDRFSRWVCTTLSSVFSYCTIECS